MSDIIFIASALCFALAVLLLPFAFSRQKYCRRCGMSTHYPEQCHG